MGKSIAWRVPVRIGMPRGLRLRWPHAARRSSRGAARPLRVRFGASKLALVIAFTLASFSVAGCSGDAGRGALIGGGLGVAGGTLIGHQSGHATEGALIGGLIGASTGSALGAQRDLARERQCGRFAYDDGYHGAYDDGYYQDRRPRRRHYHDHYCDH